MLPCSQYARMMEEPVAHVQKAQAEIPTVDTEVKLESVALSDTFHLLYLLPVARTQNGHPGHKHQLQCSEKEILARVRSTVFAKEDKQGCLYEAVQS